MPFEFTHVLDEYGVGDALRELRKRRNLTQLQVSNIFGLCQEHYSRIEQGRKHMSISLAIRFAEYYDVSISEILVVKKGVA